MNTLIWRLRQLANRLSAAGLAGLALLAAALLLARVETAPALARIAEQQRALEQLRARAAAHDTPAAAPAGPLAGLPPTGAAAQQVGELEQLARAHGIALPRGQYNATAQAGTPLVRWQIALPVEATYPALHAWLAAALERLPNLALDEIKLKRDRIESRTLQADVRLSLYVDTAP